ncbi:hypothetical protein L207DRAFT_606140 [Hyaloscypha variabilis F]|uniref:Rhodopsin domain-containing protein n=1 Tax=Hyaloscypha variabilis (strain UAMH 11265 / GT02V1 / F) TaxID=1149755 RepID=A0A2J6S8I8_HYAVF|nr:hypothetical protein L207DRAFT_606140 [Hyaloscypha variabilis F]
MATNMQPDVNIGPSAVIAGWTEASIAVIVVTARTYAQAKVVGRMGVEDYLMIAALIVAMLNTSLITHAVSWGIGRHIYYLTPIETINAIKFEFIAQTPGIVAPTLARVSFAIYLLKFVGTSKLRRYLLWSVVWSQVIVNIIQIVLILAQCQHFAALWNPAVGGKCWSRKVQVYSGYFLGALNCTHDLILTFLPVVVLKDLNITRRIKVILGVLMGMSIFAFAASIVKTIELGNLGKVSDFTYFTVSFIIWFTIENYVVIIAASIPSLRPLLLHVKKQVSSRGDSYAMNTYGAKRATKGYVPYGEGRDGTLKSTNNRTTTNVTGSVITELRRGWMLW